MQALNDKQAQTWSWALAIGSAITIGLFYSLNQLGRTGTPAEPPVMRISLSQWLPPAPPQTKPPPPPPKAVPKAPPKPKPKPETPAPPKPEAKPVITEQSVSEPMPASQPEPEPPVAPEPLPEPSVEPTEVVEAKEPALVATPLFELSRLPSFIHKAMPAYPTLERRRGREADVILEVFIDPTGKTGDITVKQSAGQAFDQAAIEAIRKSRFSPGEVDGTAVAVIMTLPVRFRLR